MARTFGPPAEADVGDEFRNGDRADMGAVRRATVYAAGSRGPDIAVGVAAEAIVGSVPQRREVR